MPADWLCADIWIVLLLTCPFVYLLIKNAKRRPSRTSDVCEKCGYSHKGLPTNRCPECGTQFDPQSGLRKDHGRGQQLGHRTVNTLLLVIIAIIVIGVFGYSCYVYAVFDA